MNRKKIFSLQFSGLPTVRRLLCSNVENGNAFTSTSRIQSSWERVQFVEMLRSVKECIYVPLEWEMKRCSVRQQKGRREIRQRHLWWWWLLAYLFGKQTKNYTCHTRIDPCLSADCDSHQASNRIIMTVLIRLQNLRNTWHFTVITTHLQEAKTILQMARRKAGVNGIESSREKFKWFLRLLESCEWHTQTRRWWIHKPKPNMTNQHRCRWLTFAIIY